MYSKKEIFEFLNTIQDPEIPAISIVELGVVRDVEITEEKCIVSYTPTYSGCPATGRFKQDILELLTEKGIKNIELKLQNFPAWTTDWMNEETREKLRVYGIAPPIKGTEDKGILFANGPKVVPCVKCKSKNTELKSQFGSTACKSLYQCKDCLEPFDYFKCI